MTTKNFISQELSVLIILVILFENEIPNEHTTSTDFHHYAFFVLSQFV